MFKATTQKGPLMKYIVIEQTSDEPGLKVQFIAETKAEVQGWLAAFKKASGDMWNASSMLVLPYDE